MKFSIRKLLVVAAMVGLSCGWYLTWQRGDGDRKKSEQQLRVAEEELLRAKGELAERAKRQAKRVSSQRCRAPASRGLRERRRAHECHRPMSATAR